jgi:hypothetical protein
MGKEIAGFAKNSGTARGAEFSPPILRKKGVGVMTRQLRIVVLVSLLLSLNAAAWGDFYVIPTTPAFVGTRITSLPYPITQSGFYYVSGNLSCPGAQNGIIVSADDVTIDLAGFTLTGNGGESYGVWIGGQQNVEVRNGTVRGFYFGIGSNFPSTRIINIRAESNINTGFGIYGDGSLIMGCYACNNINGFDIMGSANVLNNVAYNNSGIGFYMNESPLQLVDRNVASQNGTDWEALTGCTVGLNTPPPITASATAEAVQKAKIPKRSGLRIIK